MIDLEKEREAFEINWLSLGGKLDNFEYTTDQMYSLSKEASKKLSEQDKLISIMIINQSWSYWLNFARANQAEITELKQKLEKLESGEFVLVPKLATKKGGYYLRDTRLPIGNCMKFWYTHGYGTKHSKFHWFESLEQAQHHAGGAGWFEIWYAPYIDSIIESTVDIQKAYRSEEKAMIEKMENYHE